MAPNIKFTVPNKLFENDNNTLEIDLHFKNMRDFHPDGIVNKIGPMSKLIEHRTRLFNFTKQTINNSNREKILEEILNQGNYKIEDLIQRFEREAQATQKKSFLKAANQG